MAPLGYTVKGTATFRCQGRTWTSHNAWVTFIVDRHDEVKCRRLYKQYHQGDRSVGAKPHFKNAEWERLKAFVLRKSQQGRAERGTAPPDARHGRVHKPHPQELCERCEELRMPCTGQLYDVCDRPFVVSRRAFARRQARLEQGPTMTLYHQTAPNIADAILRTQEMKPGQQGLAGGGIYFAESPEETHRKARKTGVILKCRVKLGSVLELGANGDPSMNIVTLLNQKRDSVLIPRQRPERVVYMSDQVVSIERCPNR